MRKVREVLRLRLGCGLSSREVAKSCGVGKTTVLEYEARARLAGLSWPLPEDLDDRALERLVCGVSESPNRRDMPSVDYLVSEMKRPHVTLTQLWLEYKAANPHGYQYTQFCHYYRDGKKKLDVVLRQEHRAGEKLFSDYAGDTIPITDPLTGKVTPAYIFVGVLGASSYTFAEAVASMDTPSFITSHIRAFEYFGGVPRIVVPDNAKCAVIKADRYEPELNPAFAAMAAHYGAAIIPTRVRKPRDKAPVESGVLVVERWILAALRNRTFFSIDEANDAIAELLERLNERRFNKMNSSRAELFETMERPALMSLPPRRYEFLEWKTAKVGIDYHIWVQGHLYSVPYQLVGEKVDVRLSSVVVEILYKSQRVASHKRSNVECGVTTNPEHRPKSHAAHLEWTPTRIIKWAEMTGPATAALVKKIMQSRPHPEAGYRSCLGIIRLAKQYGKERTENACLRGLNSGVTSYKSIKSILDRGLDAVPVKPQSSSAALVHHKNVRGSHYYKN